MLRAVQEILIMLSTNMKIYHSSAGNRVKGSHINCVPKITPHRSTSEERISKDIVTRC